MNEVDVVVLKDWPSAMDARTAAAYLGLHPDTFRKLASDSPVLRAFNYLPNGTLRWSRESLDEFRRMREAGGVEKGA